MKVRVITIVILVLNFYLFFVSNLEARSGCCSHHDGVCGCGCCDGSSLSSTCAPYYPECGSGSVLLPTATPRPTINPIVYTPLPPTPTPTRINVVTPAKIYTYTPIPTKTHTPTPTKINTPTPTMTNTLTPTNTIIPFPTKTSTPTPTIVLSILNDQVNSDNKRTSFWIWIMDLIRNL